METEVTKTSNTVCVDNVKVRHLESTNIAGRLRQFSSHWQSITSDIFILNSVYEYKIEFESGEPLQLYAPREIKFTTQELSIIDNEIDKLVTKGVIVETNHCGKEFLSTIFIRPKKDGSYRLILNLKNLNEHVEYQHFKMDTLQSAVRLMTPNCYMASVDLRDAYYSVPIHREHQKYLRFRWQGKLFQFTCLPNGLACAPRLFTKILKPVYATLRQRGHLNVGYIDDSYLQGDCIEDCQANISDTCDLFQKLGFIIHPVKSVLKPVQSLTFLGFVLDSVNMTVTLTQEKILRVKDNCHKVKGLIELPIQELARLIGLLVSSFPGVIYGPLFYRSLENDKTNALRLNKGNYQAQMRLSHESLREIQWWYDNIEIVNYPICLPNSKIDMTIYTDASKKGWGAVKNKEKIGGRWSDDEAKNHINHLELLAALFGLKSFCKNEHNIHVKIYSDNSTTVSYINSMGGTHSRECNNVAKEILTWCMNKQIWLTAAHIPGRENVEADKESRVFSDNKEWMIRPDVFKRITETWGKPSIDLFASRMNHQVAQYASWKPDPGASYIDAFSITWSETFFYAFPPFSLIARCLQKMETDLAEGLMIVPMWPTQPWYSKLLRMLVDVPRVIPQLLTSLQMPGMPQEVHPLANKMVLIVCKLSGSPMKHKDFLKKQPQLSCNLGEKEQLSSTHPISKDGPYIVIKNRLIQFLPLLHKH